MVGILAAITHHLGRNVQKQRNLEFTSVHVLVCSAVQAGGQSSVVPVGPSGNRVILGPATLAF